MNWLMFKDGDKETLEAWNESASCCLRNVSPDVDRVELVLPAAGDAVFAYANNVDLTGSLRVSFRGGAMQEFEIPSRTMACS